MRLMVKNLDGRMIDEIIEIQMSESPNKSITLKVGESHCCMDCQDADAVGDVLKMMVKKITMRETHDRQI